MVKLATKSVPYAEGLERLQFLNLTDSKRMPKHLVKRKHTDTHPAVYRTEQGRIRNKILPHIYSQENSRMNLDEYCEYCVGLKDELDLSYDPKNWYKRMSKYVKPIKKHGTTYLTLTRVGKNLVKLVLLKEEDDDRESK